MIAAGYGWEMRLGRWQNTLRDNVCDAIVCDPPYGLGKDYGNDSDMRTGEEFLVWTRAWLELAIPKLKPSGSLYIFCTWQYAPEIFSFLKTKLTMINEIIWDRRVPSMGGTTRCRASSVWNASAIRNGA